MIVIFDKQLKIKIGKLKHKKKNKLSLKINI